jgi:hypothetical protein
LRFSFGEAQVTKAKILLTGVVSCAIQFGLAIAGWGGWHPFFTHAVFRGLQDQALGLNVCTNCAYNGV